LGFALDLAKINDFSLTIEQVAGRIVRHAGETVLKLMIDLEKLELFKGIRQKSFELSLCPDGSKQRRIQRKEKGQEGSLSQDSGNYENGWVFDLIVHG
jgi:hypothetical protein